MKTALSVSTFLALLVCASAREGFGQVSLPATDEPTFGRYYGGWDCTRASRWAEDRFWRDKRRDTIYIARAGNATQRTTVASARKCMAKFNLSNTAQRDLLGLIQASLVAEDESQTDAATEKLVTTFNSMSAQAKAWGLYQIANVYLYAAQPNIRKAEKYIAMLDAMGASAAVERMLAHTDLAGVARTKDSVPLWERELNAAFNAHKQITGEARKEYALASATVYLSLADYKARMNDPQGALRTIETARAELVPLRPLVEQILVGADRPYMLMGQRAANIEATRWFNTKGNRVFPSLGKPMLLVRVSHSCGDACYPSYSVLKRLISKFESRGLNVVLLTRTAGFYRNALVSPDSEVVKIDNYFTNIVQIPINLAVWQTEFGRREDGIVTVLSAPNDYAFPLVNFDPLLAYLVDSKGVIRLVSNVFSKNEAIFEDVIASLLEERDPHVH